MCGIALLILGLALACDGAGSGPYLPSGWKPDGPAFLLPNEKAEVTSKQPEVEAESNEQFKEYGPPKQELPNETTEKAFADIKVEENSVEVVDESESASSDANADVKAESVDQEQLLVDDDSQEMKSEMPAEDTKASASEAPVGFLEYGPPKESGESSDGVPFTEYGPPKTSGSAQLRSAVSSDEENTSEESSTTLATTTVAAEEPKTDARRRRRFSNRVRLSRRI